MVAGFLLIAAGIGIFVAAPAFVDVAGQFRRWRVDDMRARGSPRVLIRMADTADRWGPAMAVWFGRLVGALAVVGGLLMLVRG